MANSARLMRVLVGNLTGHVNDWWGGEHPRSADRATDTGCYNFDVPMRALLDGAEDDPHRDDALADALNAAFRQSGYANGHTGDDRAPYAYVSVGNVSIDVEREAELKQGKVEPHLWLHTNQPSNVATDFPHIGQAAIRIARHAPAPGSADLESDRQLRDSLRRTEKRNRRFYGNSDGPDDTGRY
jgi:hypothetical protein